MELRFSHMGLGAQDFRDLNKVFPFVQLNFVHLHLTTVNSDIDLLLFLYLRQPYWRIKDKMQGWKVHPSLLQGLIGAEGQDTCIFLWVYCLYGSNKSGGCVRVVKFVGCKRTPLSWDLIPIQNLLFLYFMIFPQNRFECLLSSSEQTVRDVLEQKLNKTLCD